MWWAVITDQLFSGMWRDHPGCHLSGPLPFLPGPLEPLSLAWSSIHALPCLQVAVSPWSHRPALTSLPTGTFQVCGADVCGTYSSDVCEDNWTPCLWCPWYAINAQ